MKNLLLLSLVFIFSCNTGNNEQLKKEDSSNEQNISENQQLNITLLLDLSDRIDTQKYPEKPEHFERDIAIVKYFSDLFVKDMEKRGTYMAKGKIKIIFSPKPQNTNVNILAEKLSVDLSKMDNKQKKEIHDNMTNVFNENIRQIYKTSLEQNKWIGSDIWRFFKNDVKDLCISDEPNYRNILVIISDGYIYHIDSKDRIENKYAYLIPENISKFNFRNNPNWESEIKKENFGLISNRTDLNNLEILLLEISPSPNYKNDEDIIKKVISNWFDDMKVKRYGIYNTDLPEYTKQRIESFIKN